MFKRIDEDDFPISGFSYSNKNYDLEFVGVDESPDCIYVQDAEGDRVCIYRSDLGKLIKALRAACDYKGT